MGHHALYFSEDSLLPPPQLFFRKFRAPSWEKWGAVALPCPRCHGTAGDLLCSDVYQKFVSLFENKVKVTELICHTGKNLEKFYFVCSKKEKRKFDGGSCE